MIEMSMLEFYSSGFQKFRVRDTEDQLVAEMEIPFCFKSYSTDINGNQLGESRIVDFPRRSLYEYEVGPAPVDREVLKAAIRSAEEQALAMGFAIKGRRLYQLVLVRDNDEKIWVRVGNEWNEPK